MIIKGIATVALFVSVAINASAQAIDAHTEAIRAHTEAIRARTEAIRARTKAMHEGVALYNVLLDQYKENLKQQRFANCEEHIRAELAVQNRFLGLFDLIPYDDLTLDQEPLLHDAMLNSEKMMKAIAANEDLLSKYGVS